MTVKHLTVDNLVRVALAGGGLRLDSRALRPDDLVRILIAAKSKKAQVILENSAALTADSMVRIAIAGEGNVIFE